MWRCLLCLPAARASSPSQPSSSIRHGKLPLSSSAEPPSCLQHFAPCGRAGHLMHTTALTEWVPPGAAREREPGRRVCRGSAPNRGRRAERLQRHHYGVRPDWRRCASSPSRHGEAPRRGGIAQLLSRRTWRTGSSTHTAQSCVLPCACKPCTGALHAALRAAGGRGASRISDACVAALSGSGLLRHGRAAAQARRTR